MRIFVIALRKQTKFPKKIFLISAMLLKVIIYLNDGIHIYFNILKPSTKEFFVVFKDFS